MKKFLVLFFLLFPLFALAHGGIDDGELIIRMTKNGFEPKELTVVEGDEVLFINNDDVEHWPASNFHPTHELYPEFDPKGGIKPGESWTMKFEKVGTWRMHDHLFPHLTGTIVVLKNPEATSTTQNLGVPNGFWHKLSNFFKKHFKKSLRKAGAIDEVKLEEFQALSEQEKYAWLKREASEEKPEIAWQYVLKAYDSPEGVRGKPHDMAHLVGQLLFKSYGLKGLSFCTPVFAFGCYHGLMEVAFNSTSPEKYEATLLEAQKGCQKLGNDENPAYWSCVHGIGHGVITYREHDTPQALADCSLLGEKVSTYCYDGVFMELSFSAVPSYYRKSDPLYPCDVIGEEYRTACARAQSRVMRERLGLNTTEIADICAKSESAAIHYNCIDSMGYLMGQNSLGQPEKVIEGCGDINDKKDREQCFAAAAGELVFQDMVGWQESAPKICAEMAENGRKLCEARIARVKKDYGR